MFRGEVTSGTGLIIIAIGTYRTMTVTETTSVTIMTDARPKRSLPGKEVLVGKTEHDVVNVTEVRTETDSHDRVRRTAPATKSSLPNLVRNGRDPGPRQEAAETPGRRRKNRCPRRKVTEPDTAGAEMGMRGEWKSMMGKGKSVVRQPRTNATVDLDQGMVYQFSSHSLTHFAPLINSWILLFPICTKYDCAYE